MKPNPVVLCILDGWGHAEDSPYNAISNARLPFINQAFKSNGSLLQASGLAVGVPVGQMGNSEIGHITIGSGRIIPQGLERINVSIRNNQLSHIKALQSTLSYLKQHKKTLHLIGLISDGGVHSHIDHIIACAKIFRQNSIDLQIHAITDGRDAPPRSAHNYLQLIIDHGFDIASISGRFYAMDRDQRFDRTEKYYRALTEKKAPIFYSPFDVIDQNFGDEFIEPHISKYYQGIKQGDVIFIANFRADRIRQIANALLDQNFKNFKVLDLKLKGLGMTSYSSTLDLSIENLFAPQTVRNTLGEVIANQGYNQLRIAETEKYAHVTYFFNGGKEEPYHNETRILIPSPKVVTYDQCPEMSAYELTHALIDAIHSKKYQFICANFANADMVGHTADMKATIKACETIDTCLSKIANTAAQHTTDLLITSDHGNAEQLMDDSNTERHTAHTINPVPFIYVGNKKVTTSHGELQDIAPTILKLMGITQPLEITGSPLIRMQ